LSNDGRHVWQPYEKRNLSVRLKPATSPVAGEASTQSRHYWSVLKDRLQNKGNETVTNCNGLKMQAEDGKMRMTDVADTEQDCETVWAFLSKKHKNKGMHFRTSQC